MGSRRAVGIFLPNRWQLIPVVIVQGAAEGDRPPRGLKCAKLTKPGSEF